MCSKCFVYDIAKLKNGLILSDHAENMLSTKTYLDIFH